MLSHFTIPPAENIGGILYLGITGIVIANIIWFKILKVTPIALVASLTFITPFVTLAFIMLLLGESISLIQVLGLVTILAGIAVQSFDKIFTGLNRTISQKQNG
jgi:drug/metabolite transporter (DMT)-like permease